jgi:hypothetical protein
MDISKSTANSNMNLGNLIRILTEITKEISSNAEVWLSIDEEGNEFLPMSSKEDMCISIDTDNMRIFFPSHR